MTHLEINRADIFSKISQSKLSQTKAAEILGISIRHTQRLYSEFRNTGIISLISRKRGKPSNHQLPKILKARVLELVTCESYKGFRPTFMCEKLKELHGIAISTESTRQLMILAGVWKVNQKRRPVIHQQRKRRVRFGELTQIDGSPHHWFEERGEPCVLIVFIDDATGRTLGKFFKSETTEAYMVTLWEYIKKYGLPLAVYSDKHAIFRINTPGYTNKDSFTQLGRALKELGIDLICANSPQAKGRVERCNQTQQDRLVKELRLAKINNIKEANKFLTETKYWDKFNKKFGVLPECKVDAHRELSQEQNLDKILCHKEQRTVSRNLEVQYENVIYQIVQENPSWSLRKAKVTIIKTLKGQIHIEYKGKSLPFKIYAKQKAIGVEVSSKEIDRFLREAKNRKVPSTHPWKQQGQVEKKLKEYQKT